MDDFQFFPIGFRNIQHKREIGLGSDADITIKKKAEGGGRDWREGWELSSTSHHPLLPLLLSEATPDFQGQWWTLPVSTDLQACLSSPEWAIVLSLCEEAEEACHSWAQKLCSQLGFLGSRGRLLAICEPFVLVMDITRGDRAQSALGVDGA